ncbi:pilus assembly protein [Brevundimonas diminuta]|uniref:TadE/TadG family type IV pilus assembly protein n=1 Tax=Brevundimonas diminuta TaxID=293 RepID=UPI0022AF7FE6|nr:TadE/TadG family type IV pilus assembly protein [Brevundimonas diminuta]MCZ4107038.1 pilus assembly protein [Brevundimonas diminuta]
MSDAPRKVKRGCVLVPKPDEDRSAPFLVRLARDQRGNTLMLVAAALIPIIGMVGAGIDIGRGYMTKTRLQQACDAGVLAGRRMQADGNYGSAARQEAANYFSFNFPQGVFGTSASNFTTREGSAGAIEGTAQTTLPTTIMSMFGYKEFNFTVTCAAKLDIANTDVMFVLDATNSMNCPATTGVYCANGNNNGVEASDSRIAAVREATESFHAILEGAKGPGTRIRYGFVPYNISVNVRDVLPSSYIVDRWTYNSRESAGSGRWTHKARTFDVSSFKTGAPVRNPAGSGDVTWNGCVEEPDTVAASSFSSIPGGAYDMDIDLKPNSDATRWRPMWPDVVYDRPANSTSASYTTAQSNPRSALGTQYIVTACPIAASRLAERSSGDVAGYVSRLNAAGNTYHDVGIMWGARLLSPTGMFAASNSSAPNGYPIHRHIIFLTDGEPHPRYYDYAAYGLEHLDHRVAGGPYDDNTLTERHVDRFSAICEAIKAKNISIWVISFGLPTNGTMRDCADPDKSFEANSASELKEQFERIATRIAQLRLDR